jgi:chromosome segregation ATPase
MSPSEIAKETLFRTEHTRDYGVFRLLLTGVDDSSLVAEPEDAKPGVSKPMLRADALAQMISDYEDDLATLTDKPSTIEAQQSSIREEMAKLSKTLSVMEGQLTKTSAQRKQIYDRYQVVTTRSNEITELLDRFKLLDAQYTNDIKRLVAIQESGQVFVLRDPMQCPLCGALPENQRHDAACDGNVTAVTTAAAAEISKIKILQTELQGTVSALKEECSQISGERKTLRADLMNIRTRLKLRSRPTLKMRENATRN